MHVLLKGSLHNPYPLILISPCTLLKNIVDIWPPHSMWVTYVITLYQALKYQAQAAHCARVYHKTVYKNIDQAQLSVELGQKCTWIWNPYFRVHVIPSDEWIDVCDFFISTVTLKCNFRSTSNLIW